MPSYTFTSHVTVSAYTTVEADSLEEAEALINDRNVVISHTIDYGREAKEYEFWIIEEADGEPFNIYLSDMSE